MSVSGTLFWRPGGVLPLHFGVIGLHFERLLSSDAWAPAWGAHPWLWLLGEGLGPGVWLIDGGESPYLRAL